MRFYGVTPKEKKSEKSRNMGWQTKTVIGHSLASFFIVLVLLLDLKPTHANHEAQERKSHVFANKLFQAISTENSNCTTVFCPLSLEIVLAVAGLGAEGMTKTQISNGLGVTLDVENLHGIYSPVLRDAKETEGQALRIASQIFVDKRFHLKEDFVRQSKESFSCGTKKLDFANNPINATNEINSWVEEKTEGLIKNILSSGDITADTVVILTNAVYFKGKWAIQFDPTRTKKGKFQLAGGNKVDVDMMNAEIPAGYGHPKSLNAKVLELPYMGQQLSMVILLPDKESSLAELESKVFEEAFDLSEILTNNVRSVEVNVSLPKFKIEVAINFKGPLQKLGMTHMFDSNANFSRITDTLPGLKVSKINQKVFLEVSEEGTEAAAATDMQITFRGGSLPPNFRANRPFIFIVYHKLYKTMLFVGRQTDPTHSTCN